MSTRYEKGIIFSAQGLFWGAAFRSGHCTPQKFMDKNETNVN